MSTTGYYYCSLDTFLNITKNSSIYLSDINKMNDTEEVVWIHNLIQKFTQKVEHIEDAISILLQNRQANNTIDFGSEHLQKIAEAFSNLDQSCICELQRLGLNIDTNISIDELEVLLYKIDQDIQFYSLYNAALADKRSSQECFICCFSKESDLLSQWRGYGDDGKGLAIGIDLERIAALSSFVACKEVSYFSISMEDEDLSNDEIELFRDFVGNGNGFSVKSLSSYKSRFFAEENEVRLIYSLEQEESLLEKDKKAEFLEDMKKIKYRKGAEGLVKYLDWSIPKDAIREVVIGPKCRLNRHDVEEYLSFNGFTGAKVTVSKGSYR